MNVEMALGTVTGLVLGLILFVIILKVTKKDGKIKCQYDERQELARGKGFKYGFFTIVICNTCMGFYSTSVEQSIFHPFISYIISIFVGVTVFVVYCIWKDAYISLNENRQKVLISFGLIAVANFVIWISNGEGIDSFFTKEGIWFSLSSTNLFCAIIFVIIFITVLLKDILDKREE